MRRARATQRCCSVTGALVVLTALLSCASLYAVIATSSSVFRTRPGLAEVIKHDGRREMDTSTDRARKSSLTSDGVSMRPVHYAMPTGHPASPVAVAFQLPSDAPQDWGAVQPKQPLYGEKSDTSQAAPRTLPLPIISQPVTEAGGTSVETAPPLLIIGIPSVGRAGDANYLLRTLCYIESQVRAEWCWGPSFGSPACGGTADWVSCACRRSSVSDSLQRRATRECPTTHSLCE